MIESGFEQFRPQALAGRRRREADSVYDETDGDTTIGGDIVKAGKVNRISTVNAAVDLTAYRRQARGASGRRSTRTGAVSIAKPYFGIQRDFRHQFRRERQQQVKAGMMSGNSPSGACIVLTCQSGILPLLIVGLTRVTMRRRN